MLPPAVLEAAEPGVAQQHAMVSDRACGVCSITHTGESAGWVTHAPPRLLVRGISLPATAACPPALTCTCCTGCLTITVWVANLVVNQDTSISIHYTASATSGPVQATQCHP